MPTELELFLEPPSLPILQKTEDLLPAGPHIKLTLYSITMGIYLNG